MTVARLGDGTLLVVSPVAPTPEALRLLSALGGEVAHIVLPSASPEHWCAALLSARVFVGVGSPLTPGPAPPPTGTSRRR